MQNELEQLQKKNEKYEQDLIEKQRQLDQVKKEHHRLYSQRSKMERQFNQMKNLKIWNILRRLKRMVRNGIAYATGRRNIRQLLPSTKQRMANKKIKRLKYNLYEQGFTKKVLEELQTEFQKSDNRYVRKQAAWELALWHANQYNAIDAEKALKYVRYVKKGWKSEKSLRRAAIIEAECLEILGRQKEGKQILQNVLQKKEHPDLYFALANLESSTEAKIKWMNKALFLYEMTPISLAKGTDTYDDLKTEPVKRKSESEQAKVSVIIPVYNAKDTVHTAIESMLGQTWENLEILIVDDCSTDGTMEVLKSYAEKDKRIQVLSTGKNSGAYTARNIALQIATGDFVTINDADDWSHAQKIEVQVQHLLENPEVIANTTQQARLTDELMFFRRGKPGEYIFPNISSLMFRREPVMEKLGYWDAVRFGADGEFKQRLTKVFGKESIVNLDKGPYSFQRQSSGSLTGNAAFGYHGYFMGVRKEYLESFQYYHEHAPTLYYPFPMEKRLFPAPEPMWPTREEKSDDGRRHFDIIMASEFRLLGGTNMSNIEEIKAQKRMGLKTGLVQLNRYDVQSVKQMNPKVREQIDGENVQVVAYGEKVTCDILIIRHPPILQEWQKYVPEIDAKKIYVIANQTPKVEYSATGRTLYDVKTVEKRVQAYFGKKSTWFPIGPLIREALVTSHKDELKYIHLAEEDWINIIDVHEWRRKERPKNDPIKIGRHSRDQHVKWPETKDALLQVYPDSPEYEVCILGGANTPKKLLGTLPSNWHVLEFGEMEPKEFLAQLDVFVYFGHSQLVEAFGRVIFEAMAAGVPVIIPPSFKALFGEAAIYAEPSQVQEKVQHLVKHPDVYEKQVEKAFMYVEERFGYTKHAERLEDGIVGKNLR